MPVAGGEKSYTNVDFGDTNRVMAVLITGYRGLFFIVPLIEKDEGLLGFRAVAARLRQQDSPHR
jgi:hypothetical protein